MDLILIENMTIDMLYHPELAPIYHGYQICIFSISSLTFILSIYTILKKSTENMGIYKILLFNQIIWSYLLDLSFFIWQPMFMFPFFLVYSIGLAKLFQAYGPVIMYCVTDFCMKGLLNSIFLSFAFRVSRIYDASKLAKMFDSQFHLIKWTILSPLFLYLITSGKIE
jgi:hypothetical protein